MARSAFESSEIAHRFAATKVKGSRKGRRSMMHMPQCEKVLETIALLIAIGGSLALCVLVFTIG